MVLANWTVFPTPLIWDKANGMLPFPEHGPRRTYEAILYAWRGDRKTLCIKSDVIRVSPVHDLKVGAQKPVALYLDLLSRSARPGDSVLDCFGGSGPILVAANRMRLAATYIERNEDAYNIALSRSTVMEIDDGGVEQDGLEDIPF
jgi:DNA modification methylase